MTDNELTHYGVLGMKWGVRRNKNASSTTHQYEKRHLGIDDKGNINLIRGKSTKKAKTIFAIKSLATLSTLSLAACLKKDPSVIMRGRDSVDKIMKKNNVTSDVISDSGIYSKKLGRMLTIAEVIAAGL